MCIKLIVMLMKHKRKNHKQYNHIKETVELLVYHGTKVYMDYFVTMVVIHIHTRASAYIINIHRSIVV